MQKTKVIEHMFDCAYGGASKIIEDGSDVQPLLLIHRGVEDHIDLCIFDESMTKDAIAAFQKSAAVEHVTLLVMEAWLLEVKEEDPRSEEIEVGELRISEQHDKKEVVIFILMTPTGQLMTACPINRREDGAFTLVRVPFDFDDKSVMGYRGRFAREEPPHNVQ